MFSKMSKNDPIHAIQLLSPTAVVDLAPRLAEIERRGNLHSLDRGKPETPPQIFEAPRSTCEALGSIEVFALIALVPYKYCLGDIGCREASCSLMGRCTLLVGEVPRIGSG